MAVEDDLIVKNVARKVISPKTYHIDNLIDDEKILDVTQIAEILTYAKEGKDPLLFTMMTLLMFTGIRPGEGRGLYKADNETESGI